MPFRRALGPLLAALTLALFVLAGGLGVDWGPLGPLRTGLDRLDGRLQALRPLPASGRVVLVSIDDDSERALGAWPFRRSLHAELLARLHAAGAAGVLLDLAFLKSGNKDDDQALEQALKRDGPVVIAMTSRVEGGRIVGATPYDPFMAACAGVAYNDIDPADTRVIRVVADKEPLASFNSMVAAGLLMLGGANPSALVHVPAGEESARIGGFTVPLLGNFTLVSYRTEGLPELRYVDALRGTLPDLRGRLVVVARTNDPRVFYPVDEGRRNMAAGQILALAIDGVVSGTAPRPLTPLAVWAVVLALDGLGVVAFFALSKRRPLLAWVCALGTSAAIVAASAWLYDRHHVWAPVLGPIVAVKAAWAVMAFSASATAQRILSSMVPDHVASQAEFGTMETRVAEATVMFQDIQGYSTMAETMEPARVLEMVNRFFGAQEDVIRKYGGQVLDFQGDAQMVVFGIEGDSGALRAVRAAWEICARLSASHPDLPFGVGIATGRVALGLIRGGARRQYSALGNTTNLAARLQSATRTVGAPLLVDEATWRRVSEAFTGERLDNLALKGLREPVTAWRVTGIRDGVQAGGGPRGSEGA